MRYRALTDLGGFLWWVIVKFTRTDLKKEQQKDKWGRNLFFLILIFIFINFVLIKIF